MTRCACAFACSNTKPAFPVSSFTPSSCCWSSSSGAYFKMKCTVSLSLSNPSSSVMNLNFTSGLYLRSVLAYGSEKKRGRKIGGYSRFTDGRQRRKTLAIDKHVHEICSHVWRVKIKPEEPMVVSKRKGRTYIQRVLHGLIQLFCWG